MLKWHWRTFSELTNFELYDILALRQDVFNLEQHCTEPDIDHFDQKAMHLLGVQNDQLVSYLRVFLPGNRYSDATSIGRVVTARSARGHGLGRAAMAQTLAYLHSNHVAAPILISAQAYLEKFYMSYGFKQIGDPFDEAGILHIPMRKEYL